MLIPTFFPVIGGAENQCRLLSRGLSALGYDVMIMTGNQPGTKSFEKTDGVDIYRLPQFALGIIPSIGLFFSTIIMLFVKRKEYDIIHSHLATSIALSPLFVRSFFRKRLVLKIGGSGITGDIRLSSRTVLGRLKLKLIKKYYDIFIAVSEEIKSELEKAGFEGCRIRRIPNGVDTGYFKPAGHERKEELKTVKGYAGYKVFLFAGRFAPPKDVMFLLALWENICREHKNLLLILLGSGPDEKEIRDEIKEKKLTNVLMMNGAEDVRGFYDIADFFVLPTHAEGLSNALLESMSCGLCVLASNIRENREIIRDKENGFLFDFDLSKTSKMLSQLLLGYPDKYLSCGDNARKTVIERYSIDKISKMYDEQVYGALNEKRAF